MKSYCNADCGNCGFKDNCKGCEATCGSPFGGKCVAAEYIKAGGIDKYDEFKESLRLEINELLASNDIPVTDALYELSGGYVNLAYPLPSGCEVKFLDDKNIYLGCQIDCADLDACFGVVADSTFILVCRYGENGSNPELITYKRR